MQQTQLETIDEMDRSAEWRLRSFIITYDYCPECGAQIEINDSRYWNIHDFYAERRLVVRSACKCKKGWLTV